MPIDAIEALELPVSEVRFPTDMRPYVTTQKQIFMASVPALVRMFIIFVGAMALVSYLPGVLSDGFSAFAYPLVLRILLRTCGLFGLPFLLLSLLFLYRAAGKQKVAGVPVWFGFDETAVYFQDRWGCNKYAWAYFNAWEEKKEFFLMNDGARKLMFPKAVWTDQEVDAIRTRLREHVAPTRPRPA